MRDWKGFSTHSFTWRWKAEGESEGPVDTRNQSEILGAILMPPLQRISKQHLLWPFLLTGPAAPPTTAITPASQRKVPATRRWEREDKNQR